MAAYIWKVLVVLVLATGVVGVHGKSHSSGMCRKGSDHDDDDDDKGYNTKGGPVPDKLNVHLVPHTHDDVGWLKTVDQYFVGSNNSIQVAAVQYIIGSVIDSLLKDPNRKFIYVEQAFFQRWWRVQSKSKQHTVKKLVKSGQLEFINGGWCMHDEASTHYIDMIDQTTLGHRYIKEQFDKVPRIGWQIDPFGHSAVQGYLLGAEVGFDGIFFARADYQDKIRRQADRSMEFIWRGSKSLGSSAQIFGGLLAHHYDPPEEFRYEIHSECAPIQDDPLLFDYNVKERIDSFVQLAQEQGGKFKTNHIMWTMGEDFAYEYAETWFQQMDKLIHYTNLDGRINAFYSTPSIYVDSKHAANETWPLKTDDFFPYADCPHCYWTGYFTSRPALKRYVRALSGTLQAARQIEVLVGRQEDGPNTSALEEALAIVQHHDGVSGTERQHVANDYAKRLYIGSTEAAEVINTGLTRLMSGAEEKRKRIHHKLIQMSTSKDEEILSEELKGPVFELCFLLNVSYCPLSESNLSSGKTLVVAAYNPLAQARKEIVRIPVSSAPLEVKDAEGHSIPSQLIPLNLVAKRLRAQYVRAHAGINTEEAAVSYLVFQASIPPLGYRTFYIRESAPGAPNSAQPSSVEDLNQGSGQIHLQSKNTRIGFSLETGGVQTLRNVETGLVVEVNQSYCWYNGSDGNTVENKNQASGAYVFRPNSSTCFPVGNPNNTVQLTVVRGPLVEEVHQIFSPWVSQVVRLYKDADQAEVEFTVGPIPIDDSLGKEIVTKLTTNLQSAGEFYTDSNGRDFLKRKRDFRADWDLNVTEPVAGNYYPLNLGMFMTDNETDFSVLVDRAVGGASIVDGELEIMLHRRLLHDDARGVSDVLNETVCTGEQEVCEGLTVQGSYYLHASPRQESAQWRRSYGQSIVSPLQLAFTLREADNANVGPIGTFSALRNGYELPPNVALLTLQVIDDEKALVRLANIYEAGEHPTLSTIATVDLGALFGAKKVDEITELTLTANQKRSKVVPLQWNVQGDSQSTKPQRGRPHKDHEVLIELGPMEIRTFEISFD